MGDGKNLLYSGVDVERNMRNGRKMVLTQPTVRLVSGEFVQSAGSEKSDDKVHESPVTAPSRNS